MGKNHLLRIAAPRSWRIKRKKLVYITRPNPGAHSFDRGMPLNVVLKEVLGIAESTKEVKSIMNSKKIFVDGKFVYDHRFIVGFMDVLEIRSLDKHYRVLFNTRGQLIFTEISPGEADIKVCRVERKKIISRGESRLYLHDGKTVVFDSPCSVGDSLLIDIRTKKPKQRLELKQGASVLLTGGKHKGYVGNIVQIIARKLQDDKVVVRTPKGEFKTSKKYAFVIGDDKPIINV